MNTTSITQHLRHLVLALGLCAATVACDEVEDVLDMLPEYTDDSPGLADGRAETVVDGSIYPSTIAATPDRLAWVAEGELWRATTAGTDAVELKDRLSPVATALAIDASSIYFESGREVLQVHHEGTSAALIAELDQGLEEMVVDGDHIYVTDAARLSTTASGSVKRIDSTTGEVLVLAADLFGPWGIDVDATHVYFSETTLGAVYRVPKEGGDVEELAGDLHQPRALAVDDTHVYFLTESDGDDPPHPTAAKVLRVPLTGGEAEVVADNEDHVAMELVVDDTHVYWLRAGSGIWRADKSSLATEKFALGLPADLALAGEHVYWTDDRREDADDAIRRATR